MDDSIGLLLLFQLVLIMLNAIFASAEIAVLSISETKLEHMADDGNGRAKKLYKLAKEPARFLATIQVAITLSGFLGSAFAADNFSAPLVEWIISLGVTMPRHTLQNIAVVVITLLCICATIRTYCAWSATSSAIPRPKVRRATTLSGSVQKRRCSRHLFSTLRTKRRRRNRTFPWSWR